MHSQNVRNTKLLTFCFNITNELLRFLGTSCKLINSKSGVLSSGSLEHEAREYWKRQQGIQQISTSTFSFPLTSIYLFCIIGGGGAATIPYYQGYKLV